jgi:hypothetical protein
MGGLGIRMPGIVGDQPGTRRIRDRESGSLLVVLTSDVKAPFFSQAFPILTRGFPAINATQIADAREKLPIILGTNTSGSIRNPVTM